MHMFYTFVVVVLERHCITVTGWHWNRWKKGRYNICRSLRKDRYGKEQKRLLTITVFSFLMFTFPPGYPNVPPQVHYHSGGLGLNPNLYASGKVSLSLLDTWFGNKDQKWTPGVSTMLQVLVSIQGLILNAKPYYNEPGYEIMSRLIDGEKRAMLYNEDTFILSLKTMMYMIRKPPKNFEDLVVGHFYSRAYNILGSCKAYMEGAQVGYLAKGRVRIVDESEGKCSDKFKAGLVGHVNNLVKEFERIGVKDCEKFQKGSSHSLSLHLPAYSLSLPFPLYLSLYSLSLS
ncbi:ubiquitin-conjugating enzyme [Medicago truncatula]|uniref:Ubiquitin-conjugating enzyme n=1 Tax=Medicago truncatula TaxID=3880 RepID=G7I334_MEDTR|nr:ubiquitin-conjugating enzyme [Medicago truncatula]